MQKLARAAIQTMWKEFGENLPVCGPLDSTLQLNGALKWGTVWTSSSTGTGIMKGRSWTFVFY